jgi:hypothetical protein
MSKDRVVASLVTRYIAARVFAFDSTDAKGKKASETSRLRVGT